MANLFEMLRSALRPRAHHDDNLRVDQDGARRIFSPWLNIGF
jgi:hypothetical protein